MSGFIGQGPLGVIAAALIVIRKMIGARHAYLTYQPVDNFELGIRKLKEQFSSREQLTVSGIAIRYPTFIALSVILLFFRQSLDLTSKCSAKSLAAF
jgi:hypothetical protein